MSGCITVSSALVDELIDFSEDIGARSPGWFRAECEECGAYTTGAENIVEDWAYEHVDEEHSGMTEVEAMRHHKALVGSRVGHAAVRKLHGMWWVFVNQMGKPLALGHATYTRAIHDAHELTRQP